MENEIKYQVSKKIRRRIKKAKSEHPAMSKKTKKAMGHMVKKLKKMNERDD